jgi:hypothetical protein
MKWPLRLWLCVAAATAYTIKSQNTAITSINGRLTQNKTITLTVSRSDFGVPINLTVINDVTNASTSVQINTSATDIVYTTQVRGYVPRDGRLEVMECCLARDPDRYDPGNDTLVPEFGDTSGSFNSTWGGGNSIQAVHDEHRFSLQSHLSLAPTRRRLQFVLGALGALAFINMFQCFINCPRRPDTWDPTLFDNYKNASDERMRRIEENNRAAQLWQNNVTSSVTNLNLAYNQSIRLYQELNTTLQLTRERQETTEQMLNITTNMIERELDYVRRDLTGVNLGILNISTYMASLVGAQNDSLRLAMNYTRAAIVNVESTLNMMFRALMDRIINTDVRMRSLTDLVYRVSGQVREALLELEAHRCLTRKAQQRLQEISDEGLYVPFLNDVGQPPASSLGPYRSVLVERALLRYGYFQSGTYYLRRKTLTLECDTAFYLDRSSDAMSWRDVLDNLGPSTCDPLEFGSCRCWVVINSQRCATNQSTILSNALNRTFDFTLNATWCTGSITNELSETVLTPNALLTHFGTQCTNEAFLAGSKGVVSGTLIPVTYSLDHHSHICDMNLASVFSGNHSNFVETIFDHWSRGYALSLRRKDVYSRVVDGTIPLNMTIVPDPFTRRGNMEMRCWKAYFMVYSAEWLPVYRFSDPVMSTTVSMRIGTSNITTKTSDVFSSQPYNFVLEPALKMVGNPFSTTTVFDIVDDELSLAETATTRKGMATYPMVPFLNSTTLAFWRYWHGVDFDHREGLNVPELSKRSVSGGFCTGAATVGAGSWCTRKDRFFFFQRNNTLVANAYDEKYDVTLVIPEGTVVANQFSDCPVAEVTPISGTTTMVKLANTQATPVVVAIAETGACSRTLPNINIAAGLTYEHLVPLCSTGNGVVLLTVSKYVGLDLEPCATITGLNVTVNRNTLVNSRGVPDLRYVNERSAVEVDRAAFATAQAQTDLLALMGRIVLATFTGLQSISVVVPNSTFLDMKQLLTDINSTSNAAYTRYLNDSSRTGLNLTNITAEFNARIQDLAAQQAAALQSYQTQLQDYANIIVNVSSVNAMLNASLALYVQTQNQLVASENRTTAALQTLLGNVSASLTQLTAPNSMGFNLFSALADVVEDAVDGTVDLTLGIGDALVRLGTGLVKLAVKAGTSLLGNIMDVLKSVMAIGTLVLYVVLLFMAFKYRKELKEKLCPSKKKKDDDDDEDGKEDDEPVSKKKKEKTKEKKKTTTKKKESKKTTTEPETEKKKKSDTKSPAPAATPPAPAPPAAAAAATKPTAATVDPDPGRRPLLYTSPFDDDDDFLSPSFPTSRGGGGGGGTEMPRLHWSGLND